MTMQEALKAALGQSCYARPAHDRSTVYAYTFQGRGKTLVKAYSRAGNGRVSEGTWMAMARDEIEAVWVLCDLNGNVTAKVDAANRPKLSDLFPELKTL